MRESLYSQNSFPEIGELGAWDFLAASKTKISVERQDAIMRGGSEVARIWLALQPWTDKTLVQEFLRGADHKVFKLWAEYELKKGGQYIENWAIERMAERGVFIWEIVVLARSHKAQAAIWQHLEEAAYDKGTAEIRNIVDTCGWLCKREDLGSGVKQEIIRFIKEVLDKNLLVGKFLPVQEKRDRLAGKGVAGRIRKQRETDRLTWSEKEERMIEKIFTEVVDVLIQNESVDSEELLQIVETCLPYGSWFVEMLLQRDLDVLVGEEKKILERIWRYTVDLVKEIREDSESEWQNGDELSLWAQEKIAMSRVLGLVANGREEEMLNNCLREAVEVLPEIGLGAIVNLPEDRLRVVDPRVLGPGLASKDKRTWALAVKAMNRIKEAQKRQRVGVIGR